MSHSQLNPISEKNHNALTHFPPLYTDDYHGFKTDFIEWLRTEGKKPIKGEGYSENTIKQTHYKIEEVFRWLWDNHGEYTTDISPEDADECVTAQMKLQQDSAVLDFVKSINPTCIDVGLRRIEVGRARMQWVNTTDDEIVIPARWGVFIVMSPNLCPCIDPPSLSAPAIRAVHDG